MAANAGLSAQDEAQLAVRGIARAEAERQLALLAHPPASTPLVRPCTLGDGLTTLAPERRAELAAVHARAAAAGRVSTFVPASGAATRMFKDLLAALGADTRWMPAETLEAAAGGSAEARALQAFVAGLPQFAFRDALAAALAPCGTLLDELAARGPWRTIAETLLEPAGLGYAASPKGLLAFHRYGSEVRTAFEEHLIEGARLARSSDRVCRLHFTVSPEHRARFEALRDAACARLARSLDVRFEVSFSEQDPATDTIAADPAGGPFRGDDGGLLFRPAGHGALLRNLARMGGDLVFVKNIDNVTVDRLREPTLEWSAALLGLAAELQDHAHALRERLDHADDAAAPEAARAWLAATFGLDAPADRAALRAQLTRPLRVCGMVRNTGEPGGGPFWVRGRDGGVSAQIVESAEVDMKDAAQAAIARAATHFNPVFIACAVRGGDGVPFDLEPFVDPQAVIVTRKSAGGRDLLALERPGLWNGAMARWNTLFVEVPLTVFQPVKTVLDLLRPEHQGA